MFTKTMKLCLLAALVVAALMTVVEYSAGAAESNCPGAPASRLVVGREAHITPGGSNNLRETPSKQGKLLTAVPGDSSLEVIAGPQCADNLAWWQVTYADQTGWMAEGSGSTYYIDPSTSPITEFAVSSDQTPTVNVKFDHVNFSYNGLFSKKVQAATVFAVKTDPNQPYFIGAPQFIQFTFDDTPGAKPVYALPSLGIYPVNDYEQANSVVKDRITALHTLLTSQSIQQLPAMDAIPVIPPLGAAQVFHAAVKFLKFDGGTGVGFLTMYAQGIAPITNDALKYQFVGLTDDGKFVVSGTFPVSTKLLPNTYDDAKDFPAIMEGDTAGEKFTKYMADTTAILDKASASDFTPTLAAVDQMLQSLSVK